MPYSRCVRLLVISCIAAFASSVHCAEWRECEKAKLHQLRLQQEPSPRKTAKRKRSTDGASRYQRAEEIDTWLWKNCREFSYELRKLEQEKM